MLAGSPEVDGLQPLTLMPIAHIPRINPAAKSFFNQSFVFRVRADPEPNEIVPVLGGQGSRVQVYACRPEISDLLEMQ